LRRVGDVAVRAAAGQDEQQEHRTPQEVRPHPRVQHRPFQCYLQAKNVSWMRRKSLTSGLDHVPAAVSDIGAPGNAGNQSVIERRNHATPGAYLDHRGHLAHNRPCYLYLLGRQGKREAALSGRFRRATPELVQMLQ
jgi:hypothetical protein